MFTQLLFFYSRELYQHTCQVVLFVLTNPSFQNSSSPRPHIPRTAPSAGWLLTQELCDPTPEVQSHHLFTSCGNEWENSRMVEHPPPLATSFLPAFVFPLYLLLWTSTTFLHRQPGFSQGYLLYTSVPLKGWQMAHPGTVLLRSQTL